MTGLENGHRHQLELVREVRPASESVPESTVVRQEKISAEEIAYYRVICRQAAGHTHQVTIEGSGDDAVVKLGPAKGYFRARVPIYCDTLNFFNRDGTLKGVVNRKGEKKDSQGKAIRDDTAGINVGKLNTYRGYVDGGTSLAKAEFNFENFTESRLNAGQDWIPMELSLGVFRTHKGKIERRIRASVQFVSVSSDPENPENRYESEEFEFETQEYEIQTLRLPRMQPGKVYRPDGTEIPGGEKLYDVFEDYAANGQLQVIVRCEDPGQYIGVGLGDVYFRARDKQYWTNFFKGYIGIWLQLMIVITLGVTFSTFLSTPVTMLATACTIILGFLAPFIQNMQAPESAGGGPLESSIRLITQQNMVVELEESFSTTFIKQTDNVLVYCLTSLTHIAPNFATLDFSEFLKFGYWIEDDRIYVALAATFALCLGLYVFRVLLFKNT